MGFGRIAAGVMTGGLSELFRSEGTELEDLRSSEQRQADAMLAQLGLTGSGGGLTLGEQFGGSLGDFTERGQSLLGGSSLENLLLSSSDPTSDIGKARSTFTSLADTRFDPSDPKTGYAAFSRALAREGQQAEDVLERESAITGNRFGTAIAGEKTDLAARLQDIRGQKLAQIYQGSLASQALGAQGLTGLADQVAQLSGLNINYGEMQRQIQDTKALRELDEFRRARNEELQRIGILGQVSGNDVPMGVTSLPGSNGLRELFGVALSAVGPGFGAGFGKQAGLKMFGGK